MTNISPHRAHAMQWALFMCWNQHQARTKEVVAAFQFIIQAAKCRPHIHKQIDTFDIVLLSGQVFIKSMSS